MHKNFAVLMVLCATLFAAACGTTTAQPYTNMKTVTAISRKLATTYGETNPTITKVNATITDGKPLPMNGVFLDGHFHKGNLTATHLSFSMLSDGSKVWAIYATDDQFSSTHTPVWVDNASPITV